MKKDKEIVPQPYIKEMTYDENSWLIIDCRTGDTPYVSFYNPKQDKDKEFETFKDFAEYYIENEFSSFDDKIITYKEKSASASGFNVHSGEDYDEDSRRSWKTLIPSGQLIEVMTDIKLENINTEIEKVNKDFKDMESETVDNVADAASERNDPYGYRGLSRKDFF